MPYRVDQRKRATPRACGDDADAGGRPDFTVHDLARFDLAMKDGVLLLPATLAGGLDTGGGRAAWARVVRGDVSGERIIWQFGVGENASSSLMVTMPDRHTTYILLANSPGLAEPAADVGRSARGIAVFAGVAHVVCGIAAG